MERNRKKVLRLVHELHEIKEEIEADLDLLVDKDLVDEMKRLGIID
jgi:hypothetical protein